MSKKVSSGGCLVVGTVENAGPGLTWQLTRADPAFEA